MNQYNPEQAPNPQKWLALDEQMRVHAVEQFHRKARAKLPNLTLHATFHVVVENQLTERLDAVVRAMDRLLNEGLDRHDAVHAIGSVLTEHIHDLFSGHADATSSQARYAAAVDRLSANNWREG